MLAEYDWKKKHMNFTHKADYHDLLWRKITGRKAVNSLGMLRKLLLYRNKAREQETVIAVEILLEDCFKRHY